MIEGQQAQRPVGSHRLWALGLQHMTASTIPSSHTPLHEQVLSRTELLPCDEISWDNSTTDDKSWAALSVWTCGTPCSNTQEGPDCLRSAPITDPLSRGCGIPTRSPDPLVQRRRVRDAPKTQRERQRQFSHNGGPGRRPVTGCQGGKHGRTGVEWQDE